MVASASPLLAGSVPISRTRLIGRETVRAAARSLLLDEAVPLLTLTGPGGVGKTRLALVIAGDVASSFADGATWVDLAPLTDPALVMASIASSLGITPRPSQPLPEELAWALRSQQVLLLLDNCEHVLVETADLVGFLLARCPALQVLATSRAPLHLQGEQVLPVEPFPLPATDGQSLEELAAHAAIRLFVERARAVRPAFALTETNVPVVADLCRRLDGLPLAIELAAARCTILSPEGLLAQMTDRLRLLRGGARDVPVRHQKLHATIGWSHALLTPKAQVLFRRLGVLPAGSHSRRRGPWRARRGPTRPAIREMTRSTSSWRCSSIRVLYASWSGPSCTRQSRAWPCWRAFMPLLRSDWSRVASRRQSAIVMQLTS